MEGILYEGGRCSFPPHLKLHRDILHLMISIYKHLYLLRQKVRLDPPSLHKSVSNHPLRGYVDVC